MIEFPVLLIDSNKDIRLIASQYCRHLEIAVDDNLDELSDIMQGPENGWLTNSKYPNQHFYKQRSNNVVMMVPFLIKSGDRFCIEGIDRNFSREFIEISCATLLEARDHFLDEFSEDINMLVHDLRRMSAEIYHLAIDAKVHLRNTDYINSGFALDEIANIHELLRIRTDLIDIVGNNSSIIKKIEYVKISDVVKKVCGMMESRARADKKHIRVNTLSNSIARGPAAFEIICYTLIDNAIKYSPQGETISCRVLDLKDRQVISFTTDSYGPVIEESEMQDIFSRKFRGANARKSGKPGSGYGLYILKNLVENEFSGVVTVSQDRQDSISTEEGLHVKTRFQIVIPSVEAEPEDQIQIPPIKFVSRFD